MMVCTLCANGAVRLGEDRYRAYFHCPRCDLIFADPESWLDAAAEKARYDLHDNDPEDPRYRAFLERLAGPLLTRLRCGMHGLDYGCGPGPALARMLEAAGMVMATYDPFYAPGRAALERVYDFVTCTETAEHFHRPAEEWARLAGLIRPGGWLGVMTKLHPGRERLLDWHYINDATHVSFYSLVTFDWIGARWNLTMEPVGADVILMEKPAEATSE